MSGILASLGHVCYRRVVRKGKAKAKVNINVKVAN